MRIQIMNLYVDDQERALGFYTEKLGFSVDFNYQDFYVGIRAGSQLVHLKLVDKKDPSIPYVDEGGHIHLYIEINGVTAFAAQLRASGVPLIKDVHETPWGMREIVIHDDQGHTLYFGEPL